MTLMGTKNQIGYSIQLKEKEKAGEVFILFLLFLGGFALLTIIFQKKLLLYNEEIEQRVQTYLCFKKTFDSWANHVSFIEKTNLAIQAINAGIVLKPTPELFELKKIIQKAQDVKNKLKYLLFLKSSYCKGIQKVTLLKTFPLKGQGLKVLRSSFGLAKFKERPHSFVLPSKEKLPFIFTLRGKVNYRPTYHVHSLNELLHIKAEGF